MMVGIMSMDMHCVLLTPRDADRVPSEAEVSSTSRPHKPPK